VVRALAAVAPAIRCGVCCLSFVEPCAAGRIGGTGDLPVEALEIDAVGGAPYCDFADESLARVGSRWYPDWLAVTSAGVALNLVGEVGDKLGSLCQVGPPKGMGMERF
jgi:hypothetical protein